MGWFLMVFFGVFFGIVGSLLMNGQWLGAIGVGLSPLVAYYIAWGLAKSNILLTETEQGWCKIILNQGKFYKIVGAGWSLIGLPGVNTLYKRTMKFMKCVTKEDGTTIAEPHEDPNIDQFKTTRYPFAFPFKDEEDSHGLHLSGVLAGFARIVDYRKAFFEVSDWYSEMNTRIIACWRRVLPDVSYDDDIVGRDTPEEQKRQIVSDRLWKALNHKEGSKLSLVEELYTICGIELQGVELPSIDPPPGWRDTTLAPYKAQREAEAEKAVAAKEAEVGNRVLRIVANRCGIDFEELKEILKGNRKLRGIPEAEGGFREAFAYADNQTTRDRTTEKGGVLKDVRVGNADGTKLDSVTALAASLISLVRGGGEQAPSAGSKSDNPKGSEKGKSGKTDAEEADDFFKARGVYPSWDPLKRKPSV